VRHTFRSHYAPTKTELAALWQDGLIILDTNSILNLFRYTHSTKEAFVAVLDAKQSSLWCPHHVGLEFHRRRHSVVFDQKAAFENTGRALSEIQKVAHKQLEELHLSRHPLIDSKDLETRICSNVDALKQSVEEMQAQHTGPESLAEIEDTFQKISDLYDGRVGTPYTEERLSQLYADGASRYKDAVPPGYKDSRTPDVVS
jgi:PIN like domain